MKIGYILNSYPCRSEIFIAREIDSLRKLGMEIFIFAAVKTQSNFHGNDTAISYRPSLFSRETFISLIYLFSRPMVLFQLLILFIRLLFECPEEAVVLIKNLHTTGYFSRHIKKNEISHIHACFFSWPAVIGIALSIVTQKELSISAHAKDIFVEHGAAKIKAMCAKYIVVCTKEGMKRLKMIIPEKYHCKLSLNYHGIELNPETGIFIQDDDSEEPSEIIVAAVGRLVPKKGFNVLIKAFRHVIKTNSQFKLNIIGDGMHYHILLDLIKRYNLTHNVHLLGWLEHSTTIRHIKDADILVVPSVITDDNDRDGIPNVILEAFSSGTPIIASNIQSISEIIEHRKNGLLVESGDVKGLAAAIIELGFNRYLQCRLSRNAYEKFKLRFNLTRNVMDLAGMFQSI